MSIYIDLYTFGKVGTWSYLVGPVHLNGLLMVMVILVMVNSGPVISGLVISGPVNSGLVNSGQYWSWS
jgi:hypothetical protein